MGLQMHKENGATQQLIRLSVLEFFNHSWPASGSGSAGMRTDVLPVAQPTASKCDLLTSILMISISNLFEILNTKLVQST